MDMERFSYSPITDRPKFEWPDGARVAVWVVPNIEHYEYMPGPVRVRNPWPRMPHPDVLGYSIRDYGNRVGLWRMLEVMDRHSIRCTVSLNLANFEHYPEILEACERRNWDYMCHGIYNTQYLWDMPQDEERDFIRDCIQTFHRLTGRQLKGWFSPGVSQTLNTPDLVAEAGIEYYCDFYHDDQPTPLKVRNGSLISIPYSMDLNDAVLYRYATEGEEFSRMIMDHFDTVWHEGAEQARVMCIALHPYMMGQPHRIEYLDRALRHILAHDHVWMATGQEIANWYRTHALKGFQSHLGKEA
jgi:peptidoglycan/xylan/chitin deacetylase (PgdA/CDA1 family)